MHSRYLKSIIFGSVFWFSTALPTVASDPFIYVDATNDTIEVRKSSDSSQVLTTLDYTGATDIQALRTTRDGKDYVVALQWKKRTLRLYLYTIAGKKEYSFKVFKAPEGEGFAIMRMDSIEKDGKNRLEIQAIRTNAQGESTALLKKQFAITPSKKKQIKFKGSTEESIDYPSLDGLDDATASLKFFNYRRMASGMLPVDRYGYLDEACILHATYMKTNDILEHSEDPSLPGYTEEGDDAGRSSNVTKQTQNSMMQALNILMNGTYHRILMMVPDLQAIGFGIAGPSAQRFYYSALDISNGVIPGSQISGDDADVVYLDPWNYDLVPVPGVNETQVPTTMNAGEWPDPIVKFNAEYPTGYPITVTPGGGANFSDIYLQIFHPNGEALFAYFQPPGDQDDPNTLYQGSSYSLIPAVPLANKTTYRVKMTAKRNGEAFTKEWHFTTE